MCLFSTPEEHAANHPTTWKVTKVSSRSWALQTKDGETLETRTTKKDAEQARVTGFLVNLYGRDHSWFAGVTPVGQRSWADCKAERERIAARWPKP
jgi:hypothetical protein